MVKRLAARVGEYQKDGETKGRYVDLGVILSSENGEFILLDPAVNVAGALTQQNLMNHAKGKKPSDRLMVSIFDRDNGGSSGGSNSNSDDQRGIDDEIPF